MKRLGLLALLCTMHLGASAANEIIIGQTADFSSVAGIQMKDFNAGARAYFAKVNASGGVKGRYIRLETLDDGFSATKAAANAQQLLDQLPVVALFASRGTDPTEAVMKVAEAANVPLVAPITGADSVRESHMVFPVRAGYRSEIEGILRQLSITNTKVAVLVQNDKFGNPLADFIDERVAKEHSRITVVKKVKFERKSTDLRAQVAEILASMPNSVIVLSNPSSAESFIRELVAQCRDNALPRPMIYQTSVSDIYNQFAKLGPEIVAGSPYGQILPDPHRSPNLLSKEYLAVMEANKIAVNYRSLEGYVSAKVLVEALSRARIISPSGVKEAFENIGVLDLGGVTVRYSPEYHAGSSFFDLVTIDRRGRLVH